MLSTPLCFTTEGSNLAECGAAQYVCVYICVWECMYVGICGVCVYVVEREHVYVSVCLCMY